MDNNENIERVLLTREEIINRLKAEGMRITKQRELIISIVIDGEFSCPKEIYYEANKRDTSIGIATVYRMIHVLEEVGAISRAGIKTNQCSENCCNMKGGCTILTGESEKIKLSEEDINEALKYIMKKNGYADVEDIKAVLVDIGV